MSKQEDTHMHLRSLYCKT